MAPNKNNYKIFANRRRTESEQNSNKIYWQHRQNCQRQNIRRQTICSANVNVAFLWHKNDYSHSKNIATTPITEFLYFVKNKWNKWKKKTPKYIKNCSKTLANFRFKCIKIKMRNFNGGNNSWQILEERIRQIDKMLNFKDEIIKREMLNQSFWDASNEKQSNLSTFERERVEVINELFQTERMHLHNLKVLYKVFYRPMVIRKVAEPEFIEMLFGDFDELIQIHSKMYQKMQIAMQKCKCNESIEQWDIGQLMGEIFEGANGERLQKASIGFCSNQRIALEMLEKRFSRIKGRRVQKFLREAEKNAVCRRLQLKDMLPMEMQRMVKYPLLIEGMAKYYSEDERKTEDFIRLGNALKCLKKILFVVNSSIK